MGKRAKEIIIKVYSAITKWSVNNPQRMAAAIRCYKQGYKQAVKDLAPTAEDIRKILCISEALSVEMNHPTIASMEFSEEVLRRFNEQKRK